MTASAPVRLPVVVEPEEARPARRGDCLTAVRRGEVEALYKHGRPSDPGWEDAPDGANARRPCGYLGCKYHLWADYNLHTGSVTLTVTHGSTDEDTAARLRDLIVVPDPDVYHPTEAAMHTCALDLADIAREDGSVTLEDIGVAVGKTRERIRQVSDQAFKALRGHLGELAAREGEDYRVENGQELRPDAAKWLTLANGGRVEILLTRHQTYVVRCQGCPRTANVRKSSLADREYALCRVCARQRAPLNVVTP